MALTVCLACTTAYAVGVPACPHCGSKKSCEQGSGKHLALLAKVSTASGASSPGDTPEDIVEGVTVAPAGRLGGGAGAAPPSIQEGDVS